ncbi:hypothetical protein [Dactylosporangium salmoneum]
MPHDTGRTAAPPTPHDTGRTAGPPTPLDAGRTASPPVRVARPGPGWDVVGGLDGAHERQALADLRTLLPSDPAARGAAAREAMA